MNFKRPEGIPIVSKGKNRFIIILALFLVISSDLHSQNQAPLNDWQAQLSQAYNLIAPAKIHFIFNQPKYVAGDTAFFRGSILNSKDSKLVGGKKLINIKLLDQNNTLFLYHRFLFNEGACAGQLMLPATLVPGIYTLLAYTDDQNSEFGLFYQAGFYVAGEKEFLQRKKDSSKDKIEAKLIDNTVLGITLKLNNIKNEVAHLILSKQDKVISIQEVKFNDESEKQVTMSVNNGMKGAALLSLVNNKNEVIVEKEISLFLEDRPSIEISFDKNPVSSNELITTSIHLQDNSGIPFRGILTASVLRDDLFRNFNDSLVSMNSQLVTMDLAKKLSGVVPAKIPPNYYFKGKVVLNGSQKVVPDSTLITFYFNKSDFIYGVYVFKGEFNFPLFKNFEDEEIFYIVQDHGKALKNAMIVLPEKKFDITGRVAVPLDKEDAYYLFSSNKKVILNSYNFYLNKDKSTSIDEEELIESDYEVVLDKFEKFGTVEEILSNIIPVAKYKKNSQRESVRIFLKENAALAPEDPIYIIDGIMTDSTGYFLRLDPARIASIKILRTARKLSRYGAIGKNGLVFVQTKIAVPSSIPRPWRTLYISGISNAVSYKPLIARHDGVKMPDVRSTLYWNPALLLDAQKNASFVFYTGGITGPLRVRIEGLTETGDVFFYQKEIEVSFSKQ